MSRAPIVAPSEFHRASDTTASRTHLCGFDLNLTYPQNGHFPTLNLVRPTANSALSETLLNPTETRSRTMRERVSEKFTAVHGPTALDLTKRAELHGRREEERQQWKRDLSGRANGTIDPFYGCFLLDELIDYAVNFTFPWCEDPSPPVFFISSERADAPPCLANGDFDVYDIPDGTSPEPFKNASAFFNDNRTRAALHAPTSKDWLRNFNYPFGSVHDRSKGNQYGDPSLEPIAFLSELATNASASNVSIVFYSGNDDALVQHRGTEVVIQNMTFGGTQGFTRRPATPWFDDDGQFAGIVHQERGLTYVLFDGAGHLVPLWKPAQALVFLREFVLGSNLNGTVSGTVVVGGENATLANEFLPGGNEVFFGSSATQGTSTIPAATQAAWDSFIATATATQPPLGTNGALRAFMPSRRWMGGLVASLAAWMML